MIPIAILIPTLGRPHALAPLMENIAEVTPANTYLLVFVVDEDDAETRMELNCLDALYVIHGGTYPVKTNAGYRSGLGEFILVAGDDTLFHDGWYEAAIEAFDDPSVQVVGGPDLSPITENGAHVTMPLIRRSYVKDPGAAWGEPGVVLHEGYWHNWSETELWQLAQHRGVARFAPGCVIEHRHPTWGKGEMDETYRRGAFSNEGADAALFNQRRSEWITETPR